MSPVENLEFFEHYGIFILPALTVAEQIGIPLPAVPALLAMGPWPRTAASTFCSSSPPSLWRHF
jgi:hypothetical protein